jgi:hypothetical protein
VVKTAGLWGDISAAGFVGTDARDSSSRGGVQIQKSKRERRKGGSGTAVAAPPPPGQTDKKKEEM